MAKSTISAESLVPRKTVALAWLDPAGTHGGIFNPRFTDFGIVLPAGVTPKGWAPNTPTMPVPQASDQDHGWSAWHLHPNLVGHNVWDTTNWTEPDGSSFFGWRFENRDERLGRWLLATFEWSAPVGANDTVLGTVLSGGNGGQSADIGLLPGNKAATITTRRLTGKYGPTPPPGLLLLKSDISRWRLITSDLSSGFAARVTGPHTALRAGKIMPQVFAGYIEH
jgi:hypothetical protein